jgi:hypothetical protein
MMALLITGMFRVSNWEAHQWNDVHEVSQKKMQPACNIDIRI